MPTNHLPSTNLAFSLLCAVRALVVSEMPNANASAESFPKNDRTSIKSKYQNHTT